MERTILGLFNKAPRNMQSLGFVKVIGEVINNNICVESDYTEKYPSEGEVAFLNPPSNLELYSLGIYRVEYNDGVDKAKPVYSEYRVINKEWLQPIELLFIHKATSPKHIRNLLMNGIYLSFTPSKNCCLVLDNGTVIRIPELFSYDENKKIYKVKSGSLKDPLECWNNVEAFKIITFNIGSYNRILSSNFSWPESDIFFDCATESEIAAFTFNKLNEIFKEDINVTKSQRRDIVNRISMLDNLDIAGRVQKTIEILKKSEDTETKLECNLNEILNTYPIIREKNSSIQQAVDLALQKLELERKDLRVDITNLRNQKEILKDEVAKLENKKEEIITENTKNIQLGEQIIKNIKDQVDRTANNAADLISQISIMKPFFTSGLATKQPNVHTFQSSKIVSAKPENSFNSIDHMIDLLAFNIKNLGMSMGAAKKVAKYFVACKLANLIPLIIQSDAREFSLYASAALTGKSPLIIPPNPHFVTVVELKNTINCNLINNEMSLILIEDINSFSIDSSLLPYLKDLKYYADFRFSEVNDSEQNLYKNMVVLSADPYSHMFSNSLCLWDYIAGIDFSVWISNSSENSLGNLKSGIVFNNEWDNWANNVDRNNNLNEFFDDIEQEGIFISCAAKRNINNLYNCLIFLGNDGSEALELILINHLIPASKYFGWKEQLINLVSTDKLIQDKKVFEKAVR